MGLFFGFLYNNMGDVQERLNAARSQAQQLEQQLRSAVDSKKDKTLKDVTSSLSPMIVPPISCRRTLKGHMGKIYSMHWAESNNNLVSAAQDGVLIVWDGITTNKVHAIPLQCAWVMTCGFAPSGDLVASGGLDNACSVFNLSNAGTDEGKPTTELTGHNGHLSACRFLSNEQILTSSGDKTSCLWDTQSGKAITKFEDHTGDVLTISLSPDNNYFVSGSVDQTSRLFDIRAGKLAQMRFVDHTSDVNAVQFFPSGSAFATGSEDNSCKLYDIRYAGPLISYDGDCGVTSVAFSKSGRYFFSAYSMGSNVKIWDAMKGSSLGELKGHKERISSIGISGDGLALGTACWDRTLKIYA